MGEEVMLLTEAIVLCPRNTHKMCVGWLLKREFNKRTRGKDPDLPENADLFGTRQKWVSWSEACHNGYMGRSDELWYSPANAIINRERKREEQ